MMIMIRMKIMMMRCDILKSTRRKDNVRVWGLLSPLHLSFEKINVIIIVFINVTRPEPAWPRADPRALIQFRCVHLGVEFELQY